MGHKTLKMSLFSIFSTELSLYWCQNRVNDDFIPANQWIFQFKSRNLLL